MDALYIQVKQAFFQHDNNINIGPSVTETDVRHAIRWVMRDNPDIFWFVHQYHFDNKNGIVSFRYRCSPERSAVIQEGINDVVEKDFQINHVRSLTQLEQVAYVYKWMLTYCNYNVNSAYNQSIDSVFVRRNSVCTGYAKAAQYLFTLLGIGSRLVFGRLKNDKEDGRHCWNVVCIDGIYYHFDVCLGDLDLEDALKKAGATVIQRYGDYNYNCFCVSTDEILKTRSIEDVETIPLCNSIVSRDVIERLSRISIKERNDFVGCKLTHIGSSADIFLCVKDKNVVLKKFRGNDTQKCKAEYRYMEGLKGSLHLLHLNSAYCDVQNNVIAIEQSTPIVDLFCSHYYRPTLNGVLKMIKDITLGWMECQHQGILYRDIHVCNIYKSNDGIYKLGDFGSCTYDHGGLRERIGNPWFMSPETYISGQFDERSAVYSITAVLYFILNGMRPPFACGSSEEDALQRKINGEALPEPSFLCTMSKGMAEVIMVELLARGCEFHPDKRIQTCKELLQILAFVSSTLKSQIIDLSFIQQDTEALFDNKTIPSIYRKFANNEEVESTMVSQRCSPFSEDVEGTATTDKSFSVSYSETSSASSTSVVGTSNNGYKKEFDAHDEICGSYTGIDVVGNNIAMSDDVEYYCRTMGGNWSVRETIDINSCKTFEPAPDGTDIKHKTFTRLDAGGVAGAVIGSVINPIGVAFAGLIGAIGGLFADKTHNETENQDSFPDSDDVYGSIFTSTEIQRKSHLLVQVYLHLFEETEEVKSLAQESQDDAERRDYIPLQCKLKKGDKVDVQLNIYGETLLMTDKKSIVWQGSFTKCSFDYFVPKDINVDELSCVVFLSVDKIPVGEMRFITRIVELPRKLNPEIIARKYKKVFISYSHQDESKVKFLHEGLKLGSVPHFFDRKYLKTGDVFPQVIQDYINTADLFVLCWSENASKSEYVQKERLQALERAFPQVQPEKAAKLRIYPMSIEPHADLPGDMKEYYHFGVL